MGFDETFVDDGDFDLLTGFVVAVVVMIESSSRDESNVRFKSA